MRIALYQPDIAANTGTILRYAACVGIPVDVIGPAGFDLSDRALRRAAMDYIDHVDLTRHVDWAAFEDARCQAKRRLILATTKASISYTRERFTPADTILFGRETSGVPEIVHAAVDRRIRIPVRAGLRSLDLAISVAIISSEAIRQLGEA
jgi:tRNA (cytidine/uridine-2'-O-)-methyltransferase